MTFERWMALIGVASGMIISISTWAFASGRWVGKHDGQERPEDTAERRQLIATENLRLKDDVIRITAENIQFRAEIRAIVNEAGSKASDTWTKMQPWTILWPQFERDLARAHAHANEALRATYEMAHIQKELARLSKCYEELATRLNRFIDHNHRGEDQS